MLINHPSDDPAGLAMATHLQTSARLYTVALRNISDAVSEFNVADAALQELSKIAVRQRELAAQAANGTYDFTQRQALDAEANAQVDEFNRIVNTTAFNGIKLLDGSFFYTSNSNAREGCWFA